MSANLNRALNGILRSWGHDILLQRRTPDGRDWQTLLERHTVRHKYPAVRGLPQLMQEQPEGMVHTVDMVYYFKGDAHPREGDRIYELDPRFAGRASAGQPVHEEYGQTTWLADYSLPMRGRRGEIVYYMVGVTREEPN